MVHINALPFQHNADAAITKPPTILGNTSNSLSEVSVIGPRASIAHRRSINLQYVARPTLTHAVLIELRRS